MKRESSQVAPRHAPQEMLRLLAEDARRSLDAVVTGFHRGDGPRCLSALCLDGVRDLAEGLEVEAQHRALEDAFHIAPDVRLGEVRLHQDLPDYPDAKRSCQLVKSVESE